MPKFMRKSSYFFVYPMLVIALFGMVKYIWINIGSIGLAFSVENEFGEQVYTLANFAKLFADFASPTGGIWTRLTNTILYFLTYTFKTLVCFAVAYFLFKKVWGYKVFRVVFYLPCIVSPIIFCNTWITMLEGGGVVNLILNAFNAGNDAWKYVNPLSVGGLTTTTVILIYSFWGGFGTTLLVFVGAMNRVPGEVLDSGLIDGCGMGREFFSLIVPLVWETLSTMLLLTMMSIFTATGPILYFAPGKQGTDTISFWIFFETYSGTQFNYTATVGLFFTILAIPIVVLGRFLMNRVNSDITY